MEHVWLYSDQLQLLKRDSAIALGSLERGDWFLPHRWRRGSVRQKPRLQMEQVWLYSDLLPLLKRDSAIALGSLERGDWFLPHRLKRGCVSSWLIIIHTRSFQCRWPNSSWDRSLGTVCQHFWCRFHWCWVYWARRHTCLILQSKIF